jgi:rubrerythrin
MTNPTKLCPRTCAEVCTAIESALLAERTQILRYSDLRDQCVYPDVRVMLNELVIKKEKTIRFLENIKSELAEKFHVMDQIRDGFEM